MQFLPVRNVTEELTIEGVELSFLKINFIHWRRYRFTAKLRGRYGDFPYTPCLHTRTPLPLSASPARGTFVTIDDPHGHTVITQSP